MPASDGFYDGVSNHDGKVGYLAVLGGDVFIEAAGTVTAGNLYGCDTSGRMTTSAGSAFKALQTGSGIVRAVIWKPHG
ncbi:MAG: hypothetical protein ACREMA_08160 [Longimicrobiales bacterium]